jgi:ABC-2 type transport system permease protein
MEGPHADRNQPLDAMPLTFASNIFVDLKTMPPLLQAIVSGNPVTHLANASRGLMHGEPVGTEVLWVLVASAAIVLVASPIAMRMYRRER